MPESTLTDLIGKLFGSGWPVAAMLLAFFLVDRKRFVPGWALARSEQQLAEATAANEKLKAEQAVVVAFWIQRADEGAGRTQELARALERATDGFRTATELVTRKVSP